MKIARIIGVVILSFVFLITSGIIFLGKFYEEELKKASIQAINQKLDAKIDVSAINLAALKKFPFISIELENVVISNQQDTLLHIQKTFLQFNVMDIIAGNYNIREISLENGNIQLIQYKNGKANYQIIQSDESDESSFFLQLNRVVLNNVNVSFLQKGKNDFYNIKTEKIYLKGAFSEKSFELDVYGKLFANQIQIDNIHYLQNKKVEIDLGLYIDNEKNQYTFWRGLATLEDVLKFSITGSIINTPESTTEYNLLITGDNLDIVQSLKILPTNISDYFSDYSSDGMLNFSCDVSGKSTPSINPHVTVSFSVSQATLVQEKYNIKLKNLQFDGKFESNGTLNLQSIFCNIADGKIQGNFALNNLYKYPEVSFDLNGNLSLDAILKLTNYDSLEHVVGDVTFNFIYQGKIKELSNPSFLEIKQAKTKGNIEVQNVGFDVMKNESKFSNINAHLEMNGNDIKINQLNGLYKEIEMSLKGYFQNALAYLILEDQELTVDAKFTSKKLDLNKLISTENNDKNDTIYHIKLPKNIVLNLDANIEAVLFRKFEASNVTGNIQLKNQKLMANPVSFTTMDGNFNGGLFLNAQNSNKYQFLVNADLTNVNVSTLFFQMEDFGQQTLTSSHLKGIATADINFKMEMDSALNINPKSIKGFVDLKITKGELINFEPMNSIADYVKQNKMLSLFIKADELKKKLKHIQFETLSNKLNIENEKIYIPAMQINSNAIDIYAEGVHGFDNSLDYKMHFYLSDLLTNERAEKDTKGKTRVFLIVKGTVDDPDISYDKTAAKEGVREEIKSEQKTVKSVLKEEFGLFKKDTSLHKNEDIPKKVDIDIEWEEDEKPKTPVKEEPTTKKKKQKETINFDEDDF
jgi:hypothetical protein